MTTVFRKNITDQVLSIIKTFLKPNEVFVMKKLLPLSIELCKNRNEHPQFELPMQALVNLKPELDRQIHTDTLLTYLKNQDFPICGFINDVHFHSEPRNSFIFTIDRKVFTKFVLQRLCHQKNVSVYDSSFFWNVPVMRILVEYSSPNIAKPFHFGHFRSTIIGNFISNLLEFVGHDVTRVNYVGDWGLQYGILATGYEQFGSAQKLQEEPLEHLFEVYQEANRQNECDTGFNEKAKDHFKKMEQGDMNAISQWQTFKDLSLKEMASTYKRLGICFDETHGESMYVENTQGIFQKLLEKGIVYRQNDGSLVFPLHRGNELEEKVVLQKNDGTSLYLSRDIAAAIDRRQKYKFDSMYYVVDSSQRKHFNHLFHILIKMGYEWASELQHVPFGRILKFSTRKGSAVFLHDVLNEAQQRTSERMKNSPTTKVTENTNEVINILGISSLIINDLMYNRKSDYEFDWDKVLNMTGNSGITLQYCHARLTGIKENCGIDLNLKADLSFLTEPEAHYLVELLARFDEVVYKAYMELDASILVRYLFRLKSAIGKANKTLTVKGQSISTAQARLLLFHASQNVLCQSLRLLGITPLDHM